MKKKEARELFREKRKALSDAEKIKLDDLLLIQFQSVEIPFIHVLLSYWPIEQNNEPNTHLFTEFLKFRNPSLKICYPVTNFERNEMTAVAVDIDSPFEETQFNLYEPKEGEAIVAEQVDLVFVPLLAFDQDGYRVGYGKGFYDRYLSTCRADCIKAGFSYFEPFDVLEDCGEFDVPLDLCITPHNNYVF